MSIGVGFVLKKWRGQWQQLAHLPRVGQWPGTSANRVTFTAPRPLPDRGMMTRNGLPMEVANTSLTGALACALQS